MAFVAYSQNYGANVNPTPNYIPVNSGGYFGDSSINDTNTLFQIFARPSVSMLKYNRTLDALTLGNELSTQSYLKLDVPSGNATLNSPGGISINTPTASTAGGPSRHLIVVVNGTSYKIQLLLP